MGSQTLALLMAALWAGFCLPSLMALLGAWQNLLARGLRHQCHVLLSSGSRADAWSDHNAGPKGL